jgi:hypothetical protein
MGGKIFFKKKYQQFLISNQATYNHMCGRANYEQRGGMKNI